MNRQLAPALVIAALASVALPSAGRAQDHTWTLSFLGGVGSSVDESGSAGAAFQAGGALQSQDNVNVWLKLGTFGFDTGDDPGDLADGDVTYLTVGGEYQFFERYYTSGVFMGLGAYDIDGRRVLGTGANGPSVGGTELGLVVGATGEFRLTPNFAFYVEVSGHIVDSDDSRVLGTGLAGVALHF